MSYSMKAFFVSTFALLSLVLASSGSAQQYTKITYVHSEADGTAFAATDDRGNIEWQIDHYPYGGEYSNTEVARKNDISFAGKPYDEEIGLSYFGARWYDPDIGRFTGIDPMPVNPNDYRTFNRYAYAFNNPYKYQDPDGRLPFLIPVAIFVAKELAAEAASRATGGATDFLSGQKALKKGALEFRNFRRVDNAGGQATKGTGQNVKEGIYEFTDTAGKKYCGQSCNIPSRLKQHVNSGKLDANQSVTTTEVLGGKTAREISEHRRIQEITGGVPARFSDKVSNKVDPIGSKRRHLLDE